jgi:hypothetical protein
MKEPIKVQVDKAKANGSDLITLALVVPLRALFLMLGLGVLHNDWSQEVPALGFWASMVVSLMITGVLRR